MATAPQQSLDHRLESLAKNRETVSYALLGLAAVLTANGILLIVRYQPQFMPLIVGCFWGAFSVLGLSLWNLFREPGGMRDVEAGRFLVVGLGGLIGLVIYLVSLLYVYTWWDTVGGGLEEWQGEKGWRILVIALLGAAGLGLMFASLLVGKSEEQSNPFLRRLLYGYNAVLGGQLVLLILLIVNILGYIYLPKETDWTRNRLYTLNPKSVNILKGLEKPFKVYMILDTRSDREYEDLSRLLNNIRAVNNKVQAELVLRGRQEGRVQELMRRYLLTDPLGVVVVAGEEPKEDSQFIKLDELYEQQPFNPMRQERAPPPRTFKGEDALMTAITYLEEGKAKPIVYFLQGHGELDIGTGVEARRPEQKANELRSQLEKANYEIKPLRLSSLTGVKADDPREVVAARVPDDASVVVIAGPHTPLEKDALEALREYMNPKDPNKKKGKLLVMLDVVTTPDKQMVRTGLESFLQQFNVDVGDDRIMSVDQNNPELVYATPNPSSDQNALASGLGSVAWPMLDARTVKPKTANPGQPGPTNFQAEVLLITTGRRVWAETNLDDPIRVIEEVIRNQGKGLQEKIRRSLPVAVTVSETRGPAGDPHARLMGGESTPRLVVFGNSTWASDRSNSDFYSLFASSLAWLREKPSNIGIEAKKRDVYQMPTNTNVTRMVFLPAGLMFICIVSLGIGVWVVRRR
jgi:hypothetical protein